MARARNIKPGIVLNDALAKLAHWVRLLFVYLWTIADRAGRLEDNPTRIRASLFPYEADLDVDEGLTQLAGAGFVQRYEAGGRRFLQIVNFSKHQNPHHKEAESVIPAPEPGKPGTSLVRSVSDAKMPELSTERSVPAVLIPSSGFPLTDSLTPCERGNGLQEFLTAYPKRTKQDAAGRAYCSIIDTPDRHQELMAGLRRWLESDQWQRSLESDGGRFVPDPDRFIFERRFLEHPAGYQATEDPIDAAVRRVTEKRAA